MPISDWNFGEKGSVTSWAPTNSPTQTIRTLGQPVIFGFESIRTIGTRFQLVTTKATNFFLRSEKVGLLRSYVFILWEFCLTESFFFCKIDKKLKLMSREPKWELFWPFLQRFNNSIWKDRCLKINDHVCWQLERPHHKKRWTYLMSGIFELNGLSWLSLLGDPFQIIHAWLWAIKLIEMSICFVMTHSKQQPNNEFLTSLSFK